MAKKTIRIECEGADTVELDDLTPFQGNLKVLSEDAYQRLKHSILTLGFSFPVDAWKCKNKKYIMDAHQRITTLKRMRDEEGYTIPKLPVSWVKAKDPKEAAMKLLAAASQYGEVLGDGLHSFMEHYKLNMDTVLQNFQFPELDMTQFQSAYFGSTEEVSFRAKTGSKELAEGGFQEFDHTCPKCGFGWSDK